MNEEQICSRCKKPLHDMDKCSQCELCSKCCTETNINKAAKNATKKFKKEELCKNEWDVYSGKGTLPTRLAVPHDYKGVAGLYMGGYIG